MQNTARRPKLTVPGDGTGTVSHAGALLLTETARVTGQHAGLSAALNRRRRGRHLRQLPPADRRPKGGHEGRTGIAGVAVLGIASGGRR
jgi:hypothetical protein